MDYCIAATLNELGLTGRISTQFPSSEQLRFIEHLLNQTDVILALQNCPTEIVRDFEENGLQSLVSAESFFEKLQKINTVGSYKSAALRMDIQVATRTSSFAPDCMFNMLMTTSEWKKTLNMTPSTTEKLLSELIKAKNIIHEDQELQFEQKD